MEVSLKDKKSRDFFLEKTSQDVAEQSHNLTVERERKTRLNQYTEILLTDLLDFFFCQIYCTRLLQVPVCLYSTMIIEQIAHRFPLDSAGFHPQMVTLTGTQIDIFFTSPGFHLQTIRS